MYELLVDDLFCYCRSGDVCMNYKLNEFAAICECNMKHNLNLTTFSVQSDSNWLIIFHFSAGFLRPDMTYCMDLVRGLDSVVVINEKILWSCNRCEHLVRRIQHDEKIELPEKLIL